MVCPIYIAEIAPEKWRGRLGTLFQLGIVTGIFLTLFINLRIQAAGDAAWNSHSGWRWMLAAEVVPAIFLLAFLIKAPESPRWLIQAGRKELARPLLRKIGGAAYAEKEIDDVLAVVTHGNAEVSFLDVFGKHYRRPLIIAVLLMVFSQFSGINAVIYYSTKIFAASGADQSAAFNGSAWVGLVNFLFTLVAIAWVDKAGRRPLLLVGTAMQAISLAWMGWMFYTGQSGSLLLAGVIGFIGAFAMAMGPISWLYCSEIFPAQVRGRAMAVATFSNWFSCFIVAQTFPMLNDSPAIGPAPTFGIYALCSLLSFFFVWKMLPETKGRTLEEIEASWRN
jgi:SP family arabinose:H+ symporter-like MFS transporter